MSVVYPGDEICPSEGFLRGHGTYVSEGKLVASVMGIVERVNKLVAVKAVSGKYAGDIGDVVVGRVIEVNHSRKRWKVDVNHKQQANLHLSAITLPGGVQRRRTYEDQISMRQFYVEDDLVSAEVQQIYGDGTLVLHTRNETYGKLSDGCVVMVAPFLIKRQKTHFISFGSQIEIILGCNGYIWVGRKGEVNNEIAGEGKENIHELIARLRNCILALNYEKLPVGLSSISSVYDESKRLELESRDLIETHNIKLITKGARAASTKPQDVTLSSSNQMDIP